MAAYEDHAVDSVKPDRSVQELLHIFLTKQDRLEKRLETWQADILEHLTRLRSLYDVGCTFSKASFLDSSVRPTTASIDTNRFWTLTGGPSCPMDLSEQSDEKAPISRDSMKSSQRQVHKTFSDQKVQSLAMAASQLRFNKQALSYPTSIDERGPPKSWRAMSPDELTACLDAEKVIKRCQSTTSVGGRKTTMEATASLVRGGVHFLSSSGSRTLFAPFDPNEPCLVNVVNHPMFQGLCASMVLANAAFVGITVELDANRCATGAWEALGHACNVFFAVELLLRMLAAGVKNFYAHNEDKFMNIFDTMIVASSIVDTGLSIWNSFQNTNMHADDFEMGQSFKTLKVLRILRIFRIFRFFRELSLMVFMIFECMTSLFWAMVLLMIIMYTFAVIFTQHATLYTRREAHNPMADVRTVDEMFGTLARTTYCLFQSMLGGISWGVVADTIIEVDTFSAAMFFFYITFTMLAVLNIITGIFVDNALETSRMQRDYILQRAEKAKSKSIKEMAKLFDRMDEDGSGTISWDEMGEALRDENTAKYFAAIGLHTSDMWQLFNMIDADESGQVDLEEFLAGCTRCTGDAKSIDMQAILYDLKRLHKRLDIDGHRTVWKRGISGGTTARNSGGNSVSSIRGFSKPSHMIETVPAWAHAFAAQLRELRDLNCIFIQQIDNAAKGQEPIPIPI